MSKLVSAPIRATQLGFVTQFALRPGEIQRFQKNPVCVWAHDTDAGPIAQCTRIHQDDDGLVTLEYQWPPPERDNTRRAQLANSVRSGLIKQAELLQDNDGQVLYASLVSLPEAETLDGLDADSLADRFDGVLPPAKDQTMGLIDDTVRRNRQILNRPRGREAEHARFAAESERHDAADVPAWQRTLSGDSGQLPEEARRAARLHELSAHRRERPAPDPDQARLDASEAISVEEHERQTGRRVTSHPQRWRRTLDGDQVSLLRQIRDRLPKPPDDAA